ncbi:MAG: TrkA family potassium uptake protein [Treponema sp.]|nr:TrkA family potassium uptake protein [Treponema sp.]
MLQIAIIGLGTFAKRMIDELSEVGTELILVDRDAVVIDKYKAKAKESYIVDVINVESLSKIIPASIDGAVLDFDDKLEPSILATHYLHQMGIKNIIVETQSDTHGELLKLAGATQIIFPELEAAKRICPQLLSKNLWNYIQLSQDFAIAEVEIKDELVGTSVKDSNFRSKYGLNILACRIAGSDTLTPIKDPDYLFTKDSSIIVAGTNVSLDEFINHDAKKTKYSNRILLDRFLKKRK